MNLEIISIWLLHGVDPECPSSNNTLRTANESNETHAQECGLGKQIDSGDLHVTSYETKWGLKLDHYILGFLEKIDCLKKSN